VYRYVFSTISEIQNEGDGIEEGNLISNMVKWGQWNGSNGGGVTVEVAKMRVTGNKKKKS
jgi:hypothetical protein